MKARLSRRDWFKSSIALTAGLTIGPMFADRLLAGPVSVAERQLWGTHPYSPNGNIRLNANENPYGPSEKANEAIVQNMREGNRYPFQALSELRKIVAEKEGVDTDHIHLGAGSGSILCQAGVAFGLDSGEILSGFPTFTQMMDYAKVFNAKWDKVNLNDNLEFDYEAMAARVNPKTRLVFVCNPNNPTGTLVDPSIVSPFCQEISKKALVYSDEAYLEFLEPEMQKKVTNVGLVKKGMNVVVSRTFSKIYGLAGLRIGYIVARPDLIKKISQYQYQCRDCKLEHVDKPPEFFGEYFFARCFNCIDALVYLWHQVIKIEFRRFGEGIISQEREGTFHTFVFGSELRV